MRDKILTFSFMGFLLTVLILNIITKDNLISYTERRHLATFPKANYEDIIDASFFDKFDKYTTDQFIYRDTFRNLKALVNYHVWQNIDNNGYYLINDHLFKQEYPLNEKAMNTTLMKINDIKTKYLTNNKVYYTIIPDKNYFVSDDYLKIDYDYMFKKINEQLSSLNYLDITKDLGLKNYYRTDPHLKQEQLIETIEKLVLGMNNDYYEVDYDLNHFDDFYGSYYGQSGLKVKSDSLYYLTNNILNNASVYYLENEKLNTIYNVSKYRGIDPYDIYLDGASALIEIINDDSLNDRELIIFRDSYGSSIAPLLVPYYRKITLIDLRYLSSTLLNDYVEFNDQDVLFLYSTLIYNTNILK